MNEERVQILKMLQEGKITVEEAAKLIEAVSNKAMDQEIDAVKPVIPVANEPQRVTPVVQNEPLRPRFRWSLLTFLFSNLEGALVDGGLYENARLFCSNLEAANLRAGNFQDAWVLCTNLEGTNFEGANLEGARIFASNLDHADFRGADLRDAVILCANLEHADFHGVDLRGKTFIGVNLSGHKAQEIVVPATEA
ncbi:MAG: pentapeptide repeat-containing protein [Caldilineaceae bacterium]